MLRNTEILTTLGSSGTKRLLTLFDLVFQHEERETQILQWWLFLHPSSVHSPAELSAQSQNLNSLTQQTCGASRRPQLDWPRPGSNLNWLLFQRSPKFLAHRFRAWCHSHPSPISYLGFLLWHLWLSHPPRASVNCTQYVHLHAH